MKVRFGSSWLAPGGIEVASGFAINGQQVNDPIQYYRAAATVFRPRGLRSDQISFSVTRQFNSVKESELFVITHFADLAQQDSLYLYCGYETDETIVRYDGAVLDTISRSFLGTSVVLQYNLSGGAFVADVSPPSYVEPDSSMIKRSTTAITSGASSVTVTFASAFSSTPVVVATVQIPSGGDFIFATIRDGSVSASGFIADLSGAAPSSAYKLTWIASA